MTQPSFWMMAALQNTQEEDVLEVVSTELGQQGLVVPLANGGAVKHVFD